MAPLLFIQENGLENAHKAKLALALVALRGLVFFWLAFVLIRRRFGDIMMIGIILVPLCLIEFVTAVTHASPPAEAIGVLVLSLVPLLIILGLCALVWRLDRRSPAA